jgi:hypothetical protein
VLVAKTSEGFRHAQVQIFDKSVVKDYVVLVHGRMPGRNGECRAPVDLDSGDSEQSSAIAAVAEHGHLATTLWSVVAEYELSESQGCELFTLVHCRSIAEQSQQIRVLLSQMGHPVVSDSQHCGDRNSLDRDLGLCSRIFLHEARVAFQGIGGRARSVSCSLCLAPELWKALCRLRLVSGPLADGGRVAVPCLREALNRLQPKTNPAMDDSPQWAAMYKDERWQAA